MTAPLDLTSALKEWHVAVQALTQGDTILLLRKGGIRETQGEFTIPHRQVWLFPTYEHQKPALLKPVYAHQVQPVESGWHPQNVTLTGWAQITDILSLPKAIALQPLLPFHIWNETFVSDRLNWKPRSPLLGLLLRVYRLSTPHTLTYDSSYGGCRSWIELQTSLSTEGSAAVLSNTEYQQRVDHIREIVASAKPDAIASEP